MYHFQPSNIPSKLPFFFFPYKAFYFVRGGWSEGSLLKGFSERPLCQQCHIVWELARTENFRGPLQTTESDHLGKGTARCVLASCPGDGHVCQSVRTTASDHLVIKTRWPVLARFQFWRLKESFQHIENSCLFPQTYRLKKICFEN